MPPHRLALFALVCAVSASGQSSSDQKITGQVTDPTGAAVTNATVTVYDQDTGLQRAAKATSAGTYSFLELPTGKYRVTCEAPGFKMEVIKDNPLTTGVSIEVNCKMQVGSQTDTVNISADTAVVELTNGDLGFTVTGEQASEIQLNGRNFSELLALLPGVSTTYATGFGLVVGSGVNNSGQSINGGRPDTTSWNIDGADNKDNGGGGNNFININPDAIGEFRVLTSNYSAESGTSSGAVVNLAIRSGTKNFRGRLYEYWRNDQLAASTFNSAAVGKPKLRWNNFGGNIGGPAMLPLIPFNRQKDKLFFFFSEDMKYLRQGAGTTWTVPAAAQKAGIFGNSTIKNTSGVPYPGNVLPASAIDPNMQKLVNLFPNPNVGTASFVFNKTTPTEVHEEVLKFDYNLDSNNQFSLHYAHDQYTQLENTTNLIEYYRHMPGINTSAQWNHVFSPSLINVAQFTFTGNIIAQQGWLVPNETFLTSFTRQGLGITLPSIYNASPDIPQIAVSGYTTLSVTPLAFDNYNRIYDLKDNLTKIAGSHTLRAGVLFMRSRKNQDNPPAINGQFAFNAARTPSSGQALADALLGNFYTYSEYRSVRQGWYRFSQLEPYFQDDWRVNRRLTVNLGLRWSYMQPQYSALNNTVQFLPQYYNPAQAATVSPSTGAIMSSPNPYNGLVIPGNGFPTAARGRVPQDGDPAVAALFHNLPLGGAYTRWSNFAPRLGFAFDLLGDQTTVLRGGYGVAYERVQGNFLFGAINNAPFNPSASVLNGNVENPGAAATGPVSVQTISNSHYLDMKDPRTMTYSMGLQRKLAHNMMLTLTYVGSTAANLSYLEDINQLPLGRGKSVYVPGTKTLANTNSIRPYPGYGTIQEFNTGANFVYNSLQSQFRKQFRGAGIVNAAFTWSSARTDANNYAYQPEDSYNLRGDWGNSNYNRKKVFSGSWVYPLPFWLGGGTWYKQLLGGWQLNGLAQIQSGLPVNITISADQAGTGVGSQRPNLVGDPYSGGPVGGSQILNPAAFAVPALSTFGNLGAYNIYLPRWINVNSSVVKSYYFRERWKLDVRFEMYNVANHLSVSAINTGSFNGVKTVNGAVVSNTANWGAVSGTTDPRTMQLSMRLNF
jgi:hypothetical protein